MASTVSNCIMSNGVIVAGATVRNAVFSPDVRVREGATVQDAVLLDNVTVGQGAKLRRCIVEKNVEIPPGFTVGHDPAIDSELFHISNSGVIAVPKNYRIDA